MSHNNEKIMKIIKKISIISYEKIFAKFWLRRDKIHSKAPVINWFLHQKDSNAANLNGNNSIFDKKKKILVLNNCFLETILLFDQKRKVWALATMTVDNSIIYIFINMYNGHFKGL